MYGHPAYTTLLLMVTLQISRRAKISYYEEVNRPPEVKMSPNPAYAISPELHIISESRININFNLYTLLETSKLAVNYSY